MDIPEKFSTFLKNFKNPMFKIDNFNNYASSTSLLIILLILYNYNIIPTTFDLIVSVVIAGVYCLLFLLTDIYKRFKKIVQLLPNLILYVVPIFLLLFYILFKHLKKIIFCRIILHLINVIIILWCIYDIGYLIIRFFIDDKKPLPNIIKIENLDQYKVLYFSKNKYAILLNHEKYYVYVYMYIDYHQINEFKKIQTFNNYTDAQNYIIYQDKINEFIKEEKLNNDVKNMKENMKNEEDEWHADQIRESIKSHH